MKEGAVLAATVPGALEQAGEHLCLLCIIERVRANLEGPVGECVHGGDATFIGTPALRANGELLWFSYHDGARELWTRSPEGETSLVRLAGEAEGSRIWIDTDPDSVAWISASWNEGGCLYQLDPAE